MTAIRAAPPLRRALLPSALAAAGFTVVWLLTSPGAPPAPVAPAAAPVAVERTAATRSPARFTAITGMEVLRVAETGEGGILDLRYRVVDERLAGAHAHHGSVPAIIDRESGRALTTQWMGHAHPLRGGSRGRVYWMLFLNPGELVERGDRVAVRLGHARLTGVRVR